MNEILLNIRKLIQVSYKYCSNSEWGRTYSAPSHLALLVKGVANNFKM